MKQIIQHMDDGRTELVDAPAPETQTGTVLIRSRYTLISAGTERSLIEFGKASLLSKARQQPDKVMDVLSKVQTDGLLVTADAVRAKLAQPLPLGYCNSGVVVEVGRGIDDLKPGDRVVSNGPHAEIVRVARNLCVRIPDRVGDDEAAFTVLASIALQGVRLAGPTLGECFAVTGIGLIGLIAIQLLRAHGANVLAIDFDGDKLEFARQFGATICNLSRGDDPVAAGMAFSRNRGMDGVIVAAATKSSDPISQGARMCRKRGRIILVGVAGLQLNRSEFYEKELTFQVSCSYGPGRYDRKYEDEGADYPIGFVRWTEQRNFEAVLDMMASGRLDTKPLIQRRVPIDDAPGAFATLDTDRAVLGTLISFSAPETPVIERRVALRAAAAFDATKPIVGFIGAGNYASRVLIPAFKAAGAQLHTIATSGGLSGLLQGRSAGFAEATSEVDALLDDPTINVVAIVTRHDSHARFVTKALRAGKHVFVEKPLALTLAETDEVEAAWHERAASGKPAELMVGFNRRFAPQVIRMKELLTPLTEPKSFIMTMNAGAISAHSWVQSSTQGGGRIIGEACHFVDLMRFLAGSEIVSVEARTMGRAPGLQVREDKAAITLGFADGSFGTIHYLANGSKDYPKERIEVFCAGRVLQLDNFRSLRGFGIRNFSRMRLWRQDKGQTACVAKFLAAIAEGRSSPIPLAEVMEVARRTIEAAEIVRHQA